MYETRRGPSSSLYVKPVHFLPHPLIIWLQESIMLPKRINMDLRPMTVLLFQAFRSSLLFLFSFRQTDNLQLILPAAVHCVMSIVYLPGADVCFQSYKDYESLCKKQLSLSSNVNLGPNPAKPLIFLNIPTTFKRRIENRTYT